MNIPNPDFFCPSRIPDPKIATKERGEKNCSTFFCSHKNHKTENYINFELVKKQNFGQFKRITGIELSTQKNVIVLSKIWD
jgi:hypothetical protein